MDLKLTTATGKASTKKVEVSDANFGREFNEALIHQVVTAYLAGGRSGTRRGRSLAWGRPARSARLRRGRRAAGRPPARRPYAAGSSRGRGTR